MTRRFATLAKGLILASAVIASAERHASADPLYSVTDIEIGGYTALNDKGQAIGGASYDGKTVSGVLYSDGKVTDLGTNFLPQGINNSGQIVGTALFLGGSPQVAVRDADGTIRDLGPIEYSNSLAINNSGQVVASDYHGTLVYSADGKSSSVYNIAPPWGTSGITLSSVAGISDSGQVAGSANLWHDHSALIYTGSDGLGHPYGSSGVLGSPESNAVAVSHNGMIFTSFNSIFSPETGVSTGVPIFAHSINDAGFAVGKGMSPMTGVWGAALWDGKAVQDLNALIPQASGIHIDDALAINDNGQILAVGEYVRPSDYDFSYPFDSSQHSFLLTPVNTPEPSTLFIFAAGLIALHLGRRRSPCDRFAMSADERHSTR